MQRDAASLSILHFVYGAQALVRIPLKVWHVLLSSVLLGLHNNFCDV